MTCIIGLEHKGKVYMGGDSAAASGWDITRVVLPKVFLRDEFLIGYTTSFRMGQLLQFNLNIPEKSQDEDDLHYLITKFIPAIRECLKAGGYTKIENNVEENGDFLIGYHGKLYHVESDFSINRYMHGFDAVGCGTAYAYGAMAAQKNDNPKLCIERALEIASQFSNGVCSPFYVLEI